MALLHPLERYLDRRPSSGGRISRPTTTDPNATTPEGLSFRLLRAGGVSGQDPSTAGGGALSRVNNVVRIFFGQDAAGVLFDICSGRVGRVQPSRWLDPLVRQHSFLVGFGRGGVPPRQGVFSSDHKWSSKQRWPARPVSCLRVRAGRRPRN